MREIFIMKFPDGTYKFIDVTPDFVLSKIIKENPTCEECYFARPV